MNVKKYLKKCAEKDKQQILESEKSKSFLQRLLMDINNQNKENQIAKNENLFSESRTCPDCGNRLVFKPKFGRFMHENCEAINCWYAANEFGECLDNNQMIIACFL